MSQELEGTLTNTVNLVGTFGSEGGGGTSNYNDLINKPSINSVTLQGNKTASQLGFADVATSGNYDDLTNKPSIPAAQVNSDWNASSGVAQILNKPTLSAVASSGDYDDLTNKPSIPAAQVNSDWNAVSGVAQILNKPTIPAAQVNSDWNATSGVAEILNKPTVYQNAAELPVSSSDTTDTKTYIDTGLSGKANNTTVGTFTPKDSSVTPNNISFGCVDKLVGISARITSSLTANSLNNLGTIDIKPNTDLYIPAVSGSGIHLGFVQITSAGNVGVYSTSGGTHGVCFSASYMTT